MSNTILMTVIAIAASASAQVAPPPPPSPPAPPPNESLVGDAVGVEVTGWNVALTGGFTMVGDRAGHAEGLRGVVMLNGAFGIGLAGFVLATGDTSWEEDESQVGGYGGLYTQYVFLSHRLVHGYIDNTIGEGSWCEQSVGGECAYYDFGFVEPTINAEINLHENVRLSLGVGYRAIFADDGPKPEDGLDGLVTRTTLSFGVF